MLKNLKPNINIILILFAVIAMLISISIGINQSVWFDEAYSILLAKQPIGQLVHLTAVDVHPPLYYILLKIWATVFGWSAFALRFMSVLAMGSATIIAGLIAKRYFGRKALYFCLPLIAFSPMLLRYGFEIRMYAIASLIGVAATYILIKAQDEKNSKKENLLYTSYALLIALGMLTHYYMILIWLAHLTWLLWLAYKNKFSLFKSKWLWAYTAGIVLFLPWLPVVYGQIKNGAMSFLPVTGPMTINDILGVFSFDIFYKSFAELNLMHLLLFLPLLVSIIFLSITAFKLADLKAKNCLMLMALYLIAPVAILFALCLIKPMYIERYVAHVILGINVFLGVCLSISSEKYKKISIAALILLCFSLAYGVIHLSKVGNYNFQRYQKPAVNQMALRAGDCDRVNVILADDIYVAIELSYYAKQCDVYFHADFEKQTGGFAPLSMSKLRVGNPTSELSDKNKIYYFYYENPKLKMPNGFVLKKTMSRGGLTVAEYVK